MIKTTRTPVKLFKWDDPGAPEITFTPGSVKTILKACLVSGYGDSGNRKEPLGWEMKFEGANEAVFQSKSPQNDGWALSVVDEFRKNGANRLNSEVRCTMIKHPNAVSSGMVVGKAMKVGLSDNPFSGVGRWWLLGNEKGFILITSDNGSYELCGILSFFQFPSLVAADTGNHALYFTGSNYPGGYGFSSGGSYLSIATNYEGLTEAEGWLLSKFLEGGGVYPSPITGGFVADNCFIVEGSYSTSRMMRGLMPGVMMIMENMPNSNQIPFGTIYDNLDSGNTRYLYFKDTPRRGMLVNIDFWEM